MSAYLKGIIGVLLSLFVLSSSISPAELDNLSSIIFIEEDPYQPFAEVMPEPEGGIQAIHKSIKYPEIARRLKIEGKVYLLIYVSETGKVDDVKVIKSLGGGCDEAAVNAIKAMKFSPGKNGGAPVKVKMSLAITFKM